jgi:antitoxin HicB
MWIYPVELTKDDNNTIMVTFPDIPEAVTYGETTDEALLWAEDALISMLESYMDDRQRIPPPSPLKGRRGVALPAAVAGKVALYNTMLEKGKRKADLARMLNLAPTLVDRLLSLHHKTKIEQIETALAAFGKRLVVDVV